MYPAAPAITAGILLVGRPRPAIFLFLFVALTVQVVVSPLGNKVLKDFIPGTAYHSDYDDNIGCCGIQEPPHMAQTAARPRKSKKTQKKVSFLEKIFKFGEEPTVLEIGH